jgi:hypothetical protein
VTDDMVHPGGCFHCRLRVVASVHYSWADEANDLMLGLYCSTMRGVADEGVGPFPIWPSFSDGIVSSECAGGVWDRRGPMKMMDWMLHGSLRVAAVLRMRQY